MQLWFVTHRKKLEEVDFVDEEFLHKNVNKNGIYMTIMVCYRKFWFTYSAISVRLEVILGKKPFAFYLYVLLSVFELAQ